MDWFMSRAPAAVWWCDPAPDASGSVPIGNGDITANVWVDASGDVVFYVGKSDTWGEFGQLYKTGRLRVRLLGTDGVPILRGDSLHWGVRPADATFEAVSENGVCYVWVDANWPCLHVLAKGAAEIHGRVEIELWRKERRELKAGERHGLHSGAPYSVWHGPDLTPHLDGDEICWMHRNTSSSWRANLEMQGLGHLCDELQDPLLNRTFGGLVSGAQLKKISPVVLNSRGGSSHFACTITLLTRICTDTADWLRSLRDLSAKCPKAYDDNARAAHRAWWEKFWSRSYIHADGNEAARKVSRGYELQRYLNACAGRGAHPIKFNGSLFTVDWKFDGEDYDADYRRWGPGYWHQNTRLPYWSMLAAGDFDLMRPYFQMYADALPVARERCRKFCGHAGAIFAETMYFWGGYLEQNYGWPDKRDPALPGHLPQNEYIRRHNSSGLEVVYHALLFYRYTGDEDFLLRTALPLAEHVLDYYDLHFPRDKSGRLRIAPAQVIEQWWSAENPLPEIAGMHACLNELLALDEKFLNSTRRENWSRLRSELPDLPTRKLEEKTCFAPAQIWEGPPRNSENPELYAVFPYHRCVLGCENLVLGRETFHRRTYTHDCGWAQDGIQAALLGLIDEARRSVTQRLTVPSAYARFPAFWGPGFDWIPDQDQGGSASHALQLMCLQAFHGKIRVFPAWPSTWSCRFQLHAPERTLVNGVVEQGQKPHAEVTPDRPIIFPCDS